MVADGAPIAAGLSAPGVDLSSASFVWEATGQDPTPGAVFNFSANTVGPQWIEVEATLPDGRRIFATNYFTATPATNVPPNAYQSAAVSVGSASDIVALYHLDNSWSDAKGANPALVPAGNAALGPLQCLVDGQPGRLFVPRAGLRRPGNRQYSQRRLVEFRHEEKSPWKR